MDDSKTSKNINNLSHKMNISLKELIKIFEQIKIAKNDNEFLVPTYLEYEKYIKNLIITKEMQIKHIEKIIKYLHKNLLNSSDSTEKYNIKLSKKNNETLKKYIEEENKKLEKCIL